MKITNSVIWAVVVVVKCSACSPSTLTIRVLIPLTPTVKFLFEKNENKQKDSYSGAMVSVHAFQTDGESSVTRFG